jgi:ribosomal protein S18 acetylase RimI-like enzyme
MLDDYAALIAAGEVFVLDDNGIAGIIVLRGRKDHLLVDNIAVEPARQRQGLGRRLLAFADERARLQGISELRLYTHETMVENIAIYRRLGWKETGREVTDRFSRIHFSKHLD